MSSHLPAQDKRLLDRLRAGQPHAVTEWFGLYQPRILAFILKKVSNRQDADELVQETFINSLKHLPLFRGQSSIWTWMCGIAHHQVADYYRKKYAVRAIKTFPLGELLIEAPVNDASGTAHKVRAVLKKMRAEHVELLFAKYVDKKRVKQLATELGKTVKSVESDLFRARTQFRLLWNEGQA